MSFKYNNDIWTILLVSIQIDHTRNEDLLTGKLEEKKRLDNNGTVFIRMMLNYDADMNKQITLVYPYNSFIKYYNDSKEIDLANRLKEAAYKLIKSNEMMPYTYGEHHKNVLFPIDNINNLEDK